MQRIGAARRKRRKAAGCLEWNRQARQVGGDYYDALPVGPALPTAPHLLCVADISGKGIYASLLMANIQATLRALQPGRIGAFVPAYATAIFVRYDPVTGACEYVNGGHCDGVVLRQSGEVELLSTTGLPIGMFPKREYESATFQVHAGDTMMLYSDGVTDACTADDQEFGLERATDVLRRHQGRSAAEIQDAVFQAIDEFAGGAPQFDDITVMILKRSM